MATTIVFFAPYPTDKTIGEGMMQRIKHIDTCLEQESRTYLNIRLIRGFRKTVHKQGKLTVYTLNMLAHFAYISKIVREADVVYLHSIFNALPALPFLRKVQKEAKVVLDVHGVVPEELAFTGEFTKSALYTFIEKLTVNHVNFFIYVTHRMKKFYLQKHLNIGGKKHLVYSIQPDLSRTLDQNMLESIKTELKLNFNDVVFIYSGSAQKWQNIELMFQCIKSLHNPHYKFIILSGEPEAVREVAEKVGCVSGKIEYRKVHPSMLGYYYTLADYGFILRDDHILNRVASPTKLIEYLHYGITPIVKLSEIGDFEELGYERMNYSSLHDQMQKGKSKINQDIAHKLYQSPLQLQNAVVGT